MAPMRRYIFVLTFVIAYSQKVISQSLVAQCASWESCGQHEDSVTLLQIDEKIQKTARSAGRFNRTKSEHQETSFAAAELQDLSVSSVLAGADSNATIGEGVDLQYYFHGETWEAHRKLFIVLIVLGCVCFSTSIISCLVYLLYMGKPPPDDKNLKVDGLERCEKSNLLGGLIQKVTAEQGSKAMGVTITIQSMKVHPARGIIEVNGLRVDNPDGWQTEYLMLVKHVLIDVDMGKLTRSMGKTVILERAEFEHIDVQYEQSWSTSNLQDMLDNLTKKDEEKVDKSEDEQKAAKDKEGKSTSVTLQKVSARGIGCKVATRFSFGMGLRLEAGDIVYDNFSKEFGDKIAIKDMISILISTLLKSVIATVAGKENTAKLSKAVEDRKQAATQ